MTFFPSTFSILSMTTATECGTKIYLELWVKVQKDWRNKKLYLNDFGYSENEY